MSARLSETGAPAPTGEAYAAGSSRRIAARLRAASDGGAVELVDRDDGAVLARAPPETIRRERRLGGLPSIVLFPGGWRFLSHDHDAVDALLGTEGSDRLHRWEAWRPQLVLVVALAFVAAFAVWRWGLGALVAVAVAFTPDALTRAIDEGHLAFADRTLADPSGLGEDERDRVRRVFGRLDAVAPAARSGAYRIVFRAMPKVGPNAFALPGGTIVVTDELVRAFPEPDVIAGVLGHEIAHVAEAHGLRQVYRSLGTYLLVTLIVGDVGPVLDDLLLEGGLLLSLSYSREHELEADRIGVSLAARAGYDPAALARFFERMSAGDKGGGSSWLSTHPPTGERVREIRRLAEEIGRSGG
ncbi:MAG: M48 family metallopeptidase [Defluviicoccus sp.]|nr:M48 family metallopeptidase [Defluviicoccus sp.]